MADCTVSGEILDATNQLAEGIRVYCVRLIGADLITDAEQKLIATSDEDGLVSFVLPQGSTAYLSGNFFVNGTSFSVNDGVALSIPAASSVDLIDLAAVASFPDGGAIVQDDGVALPLPIGTFNFGAGIAAVPGAAGVATITADIASNEAVQDALSTFFPSVGAYTWAYDDALNKVSLVIAPATTAVNGLLSAADKTLLDAVPSTYALASALTSEANTRATADALLLVKASNLSDLTNAGTARTNLGLGSGDSVTLAKLSVTGLPPEAATAHAALTVTKPTNPGGLVMSALDLVSGSFAGGFLQRIFIPGSTDPVAYMNDAGHYYTRLAIHVSGRFENSGTETYAILPPSDDDCNLGVYGDIDGPAMQVRGTPSVLTQTRIADFLDGVTGNHVLSVRNDGGLWWGPSTYALQDTNLYRSAANTLKTDGTFVATGSIVGANVAPGFATTATAAGTTTLTVASKGIQVFTGSAAQTVVLPVVSTLPQTGFQFIVLNNSSGEITVNSSGGNVVQVITVGSRATFTAKLLTGTDAASWAVATAANLDSIVGLGTTGAKSGLSRLGLTHFLYYDTNTGDTVMDAVFGGAKLKFSIEGTERFTVKNDGNVNIVTGHLQVAGTKVIGARGAALTAADAGTINSGDATTDTVIANMRTRINELEARLSSVAGHGLFT